MLSIGAESVSFWVCEVATGRMEQIGGGRQAMGSDGEWQVDSALSAGR